MAPDANRQQRRVRNLLERFDGKRSARTFSIVAAAATFQNDD